MNCFPPDELRIAIAKQFVEVWGIFVIFMSFWYLEFILHLLDAS
jgi:hypothetical protein